MKTSWFLVSLASFTTLLAADGGSLNALSPNTASALGQGYAQMYDRQFETAHKIFVDLEHTRPEDPLVPTSDAAAYLFGEFDRLHILQAEFFVHEDKLVNGVKLTPDPAVRRVFDQTLRKAQSAADHALQSNPQDRNALFASVLIMGLRSDFDALIDKHYFSSLTAMKSGRITAEKLLMIDPTYYDAHLAVGVENYMLSLKAAPVRWFLQVAGAQTDREQGIERLRLTAEKGNYLQPFARLLLAVAALRAQDPAQARMLLEGLARQFPHNPIYAEELARLR